MTEDERTAGRWQGEVSATLDNHATRLAQMDRKNERDEELYHAHSLRITKLESRVQLLWSVLGAAVLALGGTLFKIWAERGF